MSRLYTQAVWLRGQGYLAGVHLAAEGTVRDVMTVQRVEPVIALGPAPAQTFRANEASLDRAVHLMVQDPSNMGR